MGEGLPQMDSRVRGNDGCAERLAGEQLPDVIFNEASYGFPPSDRPHSLSRRGNRKMGHTARPTVTIDLSY